ncbi:MAG: metal-dependent hydrolase [Bacillota bacterium]|nr:metal-dependent hydrolase [Bacillota bacterium]
MIFFGHLGLTTGVFNLYEKLLKDKHHIGKNTIDYRFVLAGSILPDLIDKPIGALIFRNTFHNSRIFAHTLLFSVILLILGIFYYRKSLKSSILLLGICSLIHLALDSMWEYKEIMFWPYYGLKFPARPEGDWLKEDIIHLLSNPIYLIPEIVGFLIILYNFIKFIKRKRLICR